MKVYLDNNVYDRFAGHSHAAEYAKALRQVKAGKLNVLVSATNLVEMLGTFERNPDKGKRMLDISRKLSPTVAGAPDEIVLDQVRCLAHGGDMSTLGPCVSGRLGWTGAREGVLAGTGQVPASVHADVRRFAAQYVEDLRKMESVITALPVPGDTYATFDADATWRAYWVKALIGDRWEHAGSLPVLNSFSEVPSLAMFLKFYVRFATDLVISNKEPQHGDWADLDQTVYFHYVDYVVTSDAGHRGLSPNYRAILNEILQPVGKGALSPKTFLSKLGKL
jgi:hypothetical protein